jgi:GDPmannose 4,6-dehydratase
VAKTALIIGISSQDGSWLADLLLAKGYHVTGTIRRTSSHRRENIEHLYSSVDIEVADLLDSESIARVVRKTKADEVYNLAAQSVPADSWSHPMYTGEVTALGVVRVAEAILQHSPQSRLYQATSREIFGNVEGTHATESTPIDANNPYGIAKAYAHMMVRSYRESYGMFACGGILFNHESERRGLQFVTRKVTAAVACIKNDVKAPPMDELGRPLVGDDRRLRLGNLDATRDWGDAREYVTAMWLMLQGDQPKDYVIATGVAHTIEDLCRVAFTAVGLDWHDHVATDDALLRPTEIKPLTGDSTLAYQELGWRAETTFEDLIVRMVHHDLEVFAS